MSKYRAIQFRFTEERSGNWIEWLKQLWGFDVWLESVPVMKVLILANILVWLIFAKG